MSAWLTLDRYRRLGTKPAAIKAVAAAREADRPAAPAPTGAVRQIPGTPRCV